ncbi:MAG: type II toxin-antitoxin system VapC family toxin [Rhizobium sp.]|nr:type II toxin-antitoxin system VapC family toxin [Rhizobium sp.]
MSFLLDTHTFLWWIMADSSLSHQARSVIEDPDALRCVSSVTAFEIANKFRIGKLDFAREIVESFDAALDDAGFQRLDITPSHALLAGQMPGNHKDPFDRLLAAQSKLESLTLVTADQAFDGFDIKRLW